jgi:hypothetical protein
MPKIWIFPTHSPGCFTLWKEPASPGLRQRQLSSSVDIGSSSPVCRLKRTTITKDCTAGLSNNTSRDIVFVVISDTPADGIDPAAA